MDDLQSLTLTPRSPCQPKQIPRHSPNWRAPEPEVRNISQGLEGVPLIMRLSLVDAMTGEPVVGALVRIQQTVHTDTCLRGSQSTDSHGIVRFTSVYPDRPAPGTSCVTLNVYIPGDETDTRAHHEAWAGTLHLAGHCGCENVAEDNLRLLLRPIAGESFEDGALACLTLGIDTFAVSSQIGLEGYEKTDGVPF
ncbi:hypothetical protein HU727_007800 [Pseudomonas sp. SWRI153]|uniref:Intradiol ring-cleavage dioxygenases domain-containing protein n=1 Tax=Pseudomonas khorasanensis TaxID=2745508 RepID=A0A923JE56_9PSED|nr:hypothetical protein [Pseudomonas khorasanensis]MBV4485489.1 hypothetical protein [Pseudomonas khorasanensis]